MNLTPTDEASVFSIPAGVPFVDSLAAGILAHAGEAPEILATYTVLLPTRRAVRGLREAFLRQGGGKPLLLPRLTPLGDLDEDELAIAGGEAPGLGEAPGWGEAPDWGADKGLAPAISSMRRLLLLARLVEKFEGSSVTPDQALRLAGELARLLDQVQTERLSFQALAGLVPADLAGHWQRTLDFLKILSEQWPAVLAEEGCIDPARRRDLMLRAQAELWRRAPPDGWVIAAGSTGTIPATADLLVLVAGLGRGCVVLPGLDRELSADDLAQLGPTHPQHGMVSLLERMGLLPSQVDLWDGPGLEGSPPARAHLINQALSPAGRTDGWRDLSPPPREALENVNRVDCAGAEEEAGVIALIMRQALEEKGLTAALVTPDRALARRVAAELGRWAIDIDDSAGRPLSHTPPGAFLRLAAEMVATDFPPLALLACLKHPLAAGGMAPARFRATVRDLEMAALRGPRPAAGLEGIIQALAEDHRSLVPWLEGLAQLARPLARILARPAAPLGDILAAHVAFCEALAESDTESGAARLWAGDGGEAAAAFIAELADAAGAAAPLAGRNYAALFDVLIAGHVVRPRFGLHPRLAIWGLLEARLQQADLMILGGLNEGTWPPDARADPWMSRPMRAAFGLPLPERRIGLAAHDFAQACAAPEVVLTRALRMEGSPSVPSRWLSRLDKLLRGLHSAEHLRKPTIWTAWQAALDAPARFQQLDPPAPRPPLASRPRRLSVTQIETWMRDPYAIYARHILRLRPLDPLDAAPDAAAYGSIIHHALEEFLRRYPNQLPAEAEALLREIGRQKFGAALSHPGVWAFWWPRFQRVAAWFLEAERAGRAGLAAIATEVGGRLRLEAPGGSFELTAIADRIDRLVGGGIRIVDYKTGAVPSKTEVAAGFAPQLPLEAAIAQAGGFDGVPGGAVEALDYWRLTGGDPAGEICSAGDDPMTLAREARAGLAALVGVFDRLETPYEARPRPDKAPRYSAYEHLARVKEWSAGGHGEDA